MKIRPVLLGLLCLAAASAWAEPERERIAAERDAANARLADQERVCADQFVVSACMEAARKEHRTTVGRLRREEIQLDDAKRHATADARRKEIAERAEAQQARASDARPEAPEVRVRTPRVPTPPGSHVPESVGPHLPGVGGADGEDRATVEKRNTEKFEARAREAEAHRDAVMRRNAERAAEGKRAAPLPTPGASAP